MGKTAKFILYSTYAIAALILFLILLFPATILKQMVIDEMAVANPDVEIRIENATLTFPLGVKLTPVFIAYAGRPMVKLDQVKLVPRLFSLFSTTKQLSVHGDMGRGTFQGQATINQDAKRPQTTLALTMTDIPVDDLEAARQWPQLRPSGALNAFIDYDSRRNGSGSAQIDMEITSAAVALNPPVVGLERMEFSQVQADINLTPRMMQIKRCEATGMQIEGKMTGSLIFRQPLGNSRVTLSCTLKPLPAFIAEHKNDLIGGLLASQTAQKRGIVFRISGTLDNPNYVMR